MAYRITTNYEFSGATLYALVFDDANKCWNGSAFGTFDGDNSAFDIALTEDANRTGFYVGKLSSNPAPGSYDEEIWVQAGGSPSRVNDTRIGVNKKYWLGGAELPIEHISQSKYMAGGDIKWNYTVTDGSGRGVPGVIVAVCGDSDGRYSKVSNVTDFRGVADFYMVAGDYYVFLIKSGVSFNNPFPVTVEAPS